MAGDNFDLQGWMREQRQGPYTGAKGVEKVALKSSKPKSKTGLNEGLMGMIDLQPVGHLSEEYDEMYEDDDIPTNDQDYTTQPGYIHEDGEPMYDIYLTIDGKEEKYGGGPYTKKQLSTVTTSIWSRYGEELDGVNYKKHAESMEEGVGMNLADKWDMIPGDEKEAMLDSVDDAEEGLADYAYMGWAMVPDEVKAKIADIVMGTNTAEPEPDEDEKMAAMAMKQAKKGAKAVKGLNPEKDIHDLLYGDEYDDDL
jgi:hypothetical protein